MADEDVTITEDEKAELAGLAAGYAEDASLAPPKEPAKVEDAPAASPPAATPVEAAPPPEKPKYARVLQQDWDNLKASAGKVANLESQLAKLTGSTPNAEKIAQQVLERVSSQTPAGLTVEISDEDFADLATDFPELAKLTRSAMERIFKKANVKGTGAAPAAPPVDVGSAVEEALLRREQVVLERTYPDWSDIVGRPPTADASVPDGNPFRAWLAQQSAEYQKAVNNTNSPADVQEAIASFKASQKAPAPARAAARRAVIEAAVQPTGDGSAPPPPQPRSVHDAFMEGYRDG